MISKSSIAGFGMNWQICHNMAFVGLSDSFEEIFQAERRCYRFGQKHDVHVHYVISEAEGNIKTNIERKEKQFLQMIDECVKFTKKTTLNEIRQVQEFKTEYDPQIEIALPNWL